MDHSGDTYMWRETGTGSILSAMVVSFAKLKAKAGSGLERYRLKTFVPVLETATGANALGYTAAPRLAYSLQATTDWIVPSRATTQQRTDLVKYQRQLTTESGYSQISDAVINGQMPF
jgi:hypothetical protein